MMILAVTLSALAIAAVVASIVSISSDGYHRIRAAGIRRDGDSRHWH